MTSLLQEQCPFGNAAYSTYLWPK